MAKALYVYTNNGPSGRVLVGKMTRQFQFDYYRANEWQLDVREEGPGRTRRYELSAKPLPYTCDIHDRRFQ